MIKKIAATVIGALIVGSITCSAGAIVKTYINEANIMNIYTALKDIKDSLKTLNNKIDKL